MSNAAAPAPIQAKLRRAAIIGGIVAAIVVIAGLVLRSSDGADVREWTNAQAVPTVSVFQPRDATAGNEIDLPGRLDAFYRAPIYARVSGYLKQWNVDIGAHVHEGQLLASIETPELDQQLAQAQADLVQAKANEALAKITSQRWSTMLKSDSVSHQAADEKAGDFEAKTATVNAQEAAVEKYQALEAFKRIIAPFDGVVTTRDTDVGALINAGSGTGPQLFTVSDVHQLRVYIRIPQSYATSIRPGMTARLTVPEYPDKTFTAKLDSSSRSIDPASGTQLVQFIADNKEGLLVPGSYATVKIDIPVEANTVQIPASAILFRGPQIQVATVDANDRVRLKDISISKDLGLTVTISGGITHADRVIDSPPDAITEGDAVHVLTAETDTGAHSEKSHVEGKRDEKS